MKMLTVENINLEDAKFALEYLDIDWNQEARKKAKEYCKHKIGFSKVKLKAQLLFDHFTVIETYCSPKCCIYLFCDQQSMQVSSALDLV